jgi:hypothetical protein
MPAAVKADQRLDLWIGCLQREEVFGRTYLLPVILIAESKLLYQHGLGELVYFEDISHLFIKLSMLRASWRPFALLSSSTDPYFSLLFNVLELT